MDNSTILTNVSISNTSNRGPVGISSTKFATEMTFHSVIFVLGTVGNILVGIVILKGKSTKCTTNWLVLNLAIADLGITLFNIPMSNIYHFTGWPFGKKLCKYFLGGFGESIVGVSVFTHASLALVRYYVVLHPMRCIIKLSHVQSCIVAIWLLAYAALSAPLTSVFDLVYSPVVKGYVCKPIWPSFEYRMAYRSSVIVLTYVIPMMTASYCYIRIYKTLKSSIKFFRKESAPTATQLMRREYKSKRLTKALFILYIFFAVTTLPLEMFYLLIDLRLLPAGMYQAHVWSSLLALFYGLTVINPIMLFYISEEYRNQLYDLFRQCNNNTREKSQNTSTMPKAKQRKFENSNTQQCTIPIMNGDCGKNCNRLGRVDTHDSTEMCLIKKNVSYREWDDSNTTNN